MTATYDGKLLKEGNSISPCCEGMHEAIILGAVYTAPRSTKLFLKVKEKGKGRELAYCPFCGAEAAR